MSLSAGNGIVQIQPNHMVMSRDDLAGSSLEMKEMNVDRISHRQNVTQNSRGFGGFEDMYCDIVSSHSNDHPMLD